MASQFSTHDADRFAPFTGPSHRLRDDGMIFPSPTSGGNGGNPAEHLVDVPSSGNEHDTIENDLSNIMLMDEFKQRCDEMRIIAGGLLCKIEDSHSSSKLVPHLDNVITNSTLILSELDDAVPTTTVVHDSKKKMKGIEKVFGIVIAFAKNFGMMDGGKDVATTPPAAATSSLTRGKTTPKFTQAQKRGLPEPTDEDDEPLIPTKHDRMDDMPLHVAAIIGGPIGDLWGEAQSSTMDGMFDDVFGDLPNPVAEEATPPRRRRRMSKGPTTKG